MGVTTCVTIVAYQATPGPGVPRESGTKKTASEEKYIPAEVSYHPGTRSGEMPK